MKTQRQMNYKASTEGRRGFYQSKDTPATVGIGLLIHTKTRSKEIVNILADLNLSIDYDHILRIFTDIAVAGTEKMKENNDVYVLPQIIPDSSVCFAVDNCDFRNDTADGKNEYHGTAQIVYRQSSTDSVQCKLKIERNQNRSLKDDPLNQKHSAFESNMKDVDLYRKWEKWKVKPLHGQLTIHRSLRPCQ